MEQQPITVELIRDQVGYAMTEAFNLLQNTNDPDFFKKIKACNTIGMLAGKQIGLMVGTQQVDVVSKRLDTKLLIPSGEGLNELKHLSYNEDIDKTLKEIEERQKKPYQVGK